MEYTKNSPICEYFMLGNHLQSEISENFIQWKFHELWYMCMYVSDVDTLNVNI